MPRYKHRKKDEIISVPNVRVIFTNEGKMEVDRDGVYNLSEYEPYSMGDLGDYSNVSVRHNPRDKQR